MIPLSAKETILHEIDEVTYQIAVPTLMSRASYRRALSAAGAVFNSDADMLRCLRDGVNECVVEEQRDQLIDLIDNFEHQTKAGDDVDEDQTKDLKDIEDFMRSEYSRYAKMEGDRAYWLAMTPILAFKQFVRGWDGLEVVYHEHRIDTLIEQIPEDHVGEVGWLIVTMMRPTKEQEKNSESQLQSDSGPETSTADQPPPTTGRAGKSGRKSTRATQH